MNKYREINTPFFSKKAYEILNSLHIQLCSELWKNCRVYTKHWVNFKVERRANGQVYFAVSKDYYKVFGGDHYTNPFIEMTDAEFLNWVSVKLKAVIVAELKDNSIPSRVGWKRDNTAVESEYLSCNENITVADIYVIYDWLKDHKLDMSSPIVKNIFGNPRSKEQIKKIKDKQSEIDFIKANVDNVIKDIDEQYTTQIAKLEKQIAELKKKMKEDIDAVNNDCSMKIRNLQSELKELDR